jgi:hypothetical protein
MAMMKYVAPIGSVFAAAASYIGFVRPWQLTWGATNDELRGPWPGDELIPNPTTAHTRGCHRACVTGRHLALARTTRPREGRALQL